MGAGAPGSEELSPAPTSEHDVLQDSADSGDFGDFMSDLGATPVSEEESVLAIRDATIAELRRNLQALRPIGDQLAETERARLALESQLAEQRVELAHMEESHHSERVEMQEKLERSEAARQKLEERLVKMRQKFARRDALATERWHKIRGMQQELKGLKEEVKSLSSGSRTRSESEPKGQRTGTHLAKLFDSNPAADSDAVIREETESPRRAARRPTD